MEVGLAEVDVVNSAWSAFAMNFSSTPTYSGPPRLLILTMTVCEGFDLTISAWVQFYTLSLEQ